MMPLILCYTIVITGTCIFLITRIKYYKTELKRAKDEKEALHKDFVQAIHANNFFKNELGKFQSTNSFLENQLNQLKKDYALLENVLEKKKNAKKDFDKKKQDDQNVRDAIEDALNTSPASFYTLKESCMNPNESRMFHYINEALDKLITNPDERKLYYVFPQVCLYSFVNISPGLKDTLREATKNKYIRKSIDYVICKSNKKYYPANWSRSHPDYTYYAFMPILLIELDGLSHSSSSQYGEDAFQRQQQNDKFKDDLFKGLNVPLIRYQLEQPYIQKSDASKVKQEIEQKLIATSFVNGKSD